ncbi:glycosyltransferase [Leptolyngbya sp. FACHB-321]|uniref:glycosyltransferase family 2 protein n=1 Tax=Leptolyngbya sp. FACHB-321 TaxID=2692807 RepID=UPI001683C68F|nr:glycosyltransferase [Leptolyngbya sp. FACHB-321]MBD2036604.1 glycosyltransferase [Leptolyngbya sp. FACHB-321]
MLYPIKVVDIELSRPIPTIEGLNGYMGLKGLVRLHGVPLGYVNAPITLGRCTTETLSKLILEHHNWAIICQLLKNGLASSHRPEDLRLEDLINLPPAEYDGELPLVTVAVCTRDRPEDIKLCLDAILKLDYPNLDILVIDNAPKTESTKNLMSQYPQARYIREPRPGLDWARNCAALEAKGEIVAYTDDDVIVDRDWVKRLAQVFAEDPDVMAVTGLVVPYELETKAQVLFEENGGFGRGFERIWYQVEPGQKLSWEMLWNAGRYGTGANMAFRRRLFDKIGYFDPALDVGTVTNGGGDIEMFFRVLREGYCLVYEPRAMIRHRHRREYEKLKTQLTNNGSAYSYLVCHFLKYPNARFDLVKWGLWLVREWHFRKFFNSFIGTITLPLDIVCGEIKGSLVGLTRYQQACKIAAQIEQEYGPLLPKVSEKTPMRSLTMDERDRIAIRAVELTQPLPSITDVTDYLRTRVFLTWRGAAIGQVDIQNLRQVISQSRLRDAIVHTLGLTLLDPYKKLSGDVRWSLAIDQLYQEYSPPRDVVTLSTKHLTLPPEVSVSVVVATFDRPNDLPKCLRYLLQQETLRKVEIIVVDNHPASGVTPPIVAQFTGVKLVNESRQGLAYARNAGIAASTGDIIIATDDDVTLPSDWLEKLVAPFVRSDVMAVTGNTLPIELETKSQWLFENYGDGGLSRGFNRFEGNRDWFQRWPHAVPAWLLGATANAAFRASIFQQPEIGMLHEPLGPGMPSGVGEDTYCFYKVIKSGQTLVYEPTALAWHTHRRTMDALRRQIYNYSKGIVSFQLTTLLRERDFRVLTMLAIDIPKWHVGRIRDRLKGLTDYPLPLQWLEIRGHLAGPWSLWRSHVRVQNEGYSSPYIPVSERVSQTMSNTGLASEITIEDQVLAGSPVR